MQRSALCRSRRELSNADFFFKIWLRYSWERALSSLHALRVQIPQVDDFLVCQRDAAWNVHAESLKMIQGSLRIISKKAVWLHENPWKVNNLQSLRPKQETNTVDIYIWLDITNCIARFRGLRALYDFLDFRCRCWIDSWRNESFEFDQRWSASVTRCTRSTTQSSLKLALRIAFTSSSSIRNRSLFFFRVGMGWDSLFI